MENIHPGKHSYTFLKYRSIYCFSKGPKSGTWGTWGPEKGTRSPGTGVTDDDDDDDDDDELL